MIIAGLVCEAACLALARLGDLRNHLTIFIALYTLQFLVMLWAWRYSDNRISFARLFFFAFLFRITLFPTMPSLSDDIYRYGWEGRVQRAGFSPYQYPPSAPELAFLRDASYPFVNHKEVTTIYPALAQLVFRFGSYGRDLLQRTGCEPVHADVYSQKSLFILFDLITVLLLRNLLGELRMPLNRLFLYAWNPLVVLEFSGSGHNDSLGILLLVAGLLAWRKGKNFWAASGLAASFLAKYFSGLLIPYFIWRKKWRELVLWIFVAAAGMSLFAFSGHLFNGVTQYAKLWQFNGSLFPLLRWIFGNDDRAKWAAAAALGAWAILAGRRQADLSRLALTLAAAALCLAPTVYTWYFIWAIPFLCLRPRTPLLVWNATIVLSYTVWHRMSRYGTWDLHPAVLWGEYLPVYGLLIYEHFHPHSRSQ